MAGGQIKMVLFTAGVSKGDDCNEGSGLSVKD